MTRVPSQVEVDGGVLAVDRWDADRGPVVVLLHAGVCDRRSWYGVADALADVGTLVAYDRRGYGESAHVPQGGNHDLDDLARVIAAIGGEPVWLVGGSAGGRLALDAALTRPELVTGLVLIAPAVSGAPELDDDTLDPDTRRLGGRLDAAYDAGDLAEINRLLAWLWLDGPAAAEGRVSGPARDLFTAMNEVILAHENDEPPEDGVNAWSRLAEVAVPTLVCRGELDVPLVVDRCRHLARHISDARELAWPGFAHLPFLERPEVVAAAVREAVTAR